jgi:PHD finger-like domain-containing protein 5A
MCRRQPGISLGRLCEKCDGKCVICDSYVRPLVLVHLCDECAFGGGAGRCVICSAPGISDAFYCKECTQQEKDVRAPRSARRPSQPDSRPAPTPQRDGCPKVVSIGDSKASRHFDQKRFKTR